MAHENKNKPAGPPDKDSSGGAVDDEFENAVTTAITGVMADAFDHDLETPGFDDIEVIDTTLSAGPVPDPDDLLEPGYLLNDRFEIVDVVHTGGMGSVYKAVDRRRHIDGSGQVYVAIKLMRESVASGHDARLALEREAARAQRLSHPNIVNVFDFDEHDGRFFLVMEWLEGESVNSLLRRISGRQLDRAFAWQIIESTAAGVQHAHLKNVVHADINPGNIFITATHEIKLLDFGVARHCGNAADPEAERLLWATKAYASPQVLSGIAPVVEDDIFSLGCVAYRLLSGMHPFPSSNVVQAKANNFEVAPIPGLPESEWQAIRRSLDYDRSNRPKSPAVFFRSTLQPAPIEPDEAGPSAQDWRWLLTTVAVLVAIATGFWWLGQSQSVAPSTVPEPAPTEAAAPATRVAGPAEAVVDASAVDGLLERAALAMAETRYIEPAGDNARDLYRDVLAAEPGNLAALRGLREISDLYVQQAEGALRAGAPAESTAALAIAAETDAANPAIEIVDYLLVAEGSQQLANSRAAALSGELDRAASILDVARQYPGIDAAAIAAVDALIVERGNDVALLAQLDLVDERIADGDLVHPAGDSARDIVLSLNAEHGGDERLASATTRLGERLLTGAAFATTAGEFTEANELLEGVESLGVLDTELESARAALEVAMAESVPESEASGAESAAAVAVIGAGGEPAATEGDLPESASASESTAQDAATDGSVETAEETPAATSAADSEPDALADEPATVSDAGDGVSPETAVNAAGETAGTAAAAAAIETTELAGEVPASTDAGAETTADSVEEPVEQASRAAAETPTGEPAQPRRQSLSELGIERYVAPAYPRAARLRDLSGYVEVSFVVNADGSTSDFAVLDSSPADVFDSSARKAVRRWRFAPREEPVNARVVLRFEGAP